MNIGSLAVSIVAKTQKFEKGINRVRRLSKIAGKALTKLGAIASGIGAALGVAGLSAGVKRAADQIDRLAKASDKLNVPIERLVALGHAAEQTGVSSQTLATALQRMTRRIAEASIGAGEARGALKELGLNAQTLSTLTADRQFAKIADAMQRVEGQSHKVRLAMKLFDSEGVGLVNTLKVGSEGLDKFEQDAKRLGIVVTRDGAASVEAMNDAIDRSQKAFGGFFTQQTVKLSPAIKDAADRVTELLQSFKSTESIADRLQPLVSGFGVVGDVIHTVKLGFSGLSTLATKAIAFIVRGVDKLQKAIVDLANQIPGVSIQASTLISTMADELERKGSEQYAQLMKDFESKTPSELLKKALESEPIKVPVEPAGLDLVKKAEGVLGSVGNRVADLFGKAATEMKAADDALKKTLLNDALASITFGLLGERAIRANKAAEKKTPLEISPLAARSANSLDGQAALRRNLRGGKADREVPEKIDRTNDLLEDAVELLDDFKFFGLKEFRIN